jgi:hypothetical protein
VKTLLLFLALGAAAGFWADSMRARETALRRVRTLCREMGLQLLDDTVRFASLRPCRGGDGRLHLCRRYRFEFSIHAVDRHEGEVALQGRRVLSVRLEHPEGPVLLAETYRR